MVDTHGVSDEVEEPEATIKKSRRKSNSFRTTRPEVTTVKRKSAKRADPEPVSPELSDSSSDQSWEIAQHHYDVRWVEKASNTRRSESPKSRQAREQTHHIIDSGLSLPPNPRHRAELRDEEEASNASDRNEPPPPGGLREPTRYKIDNGRSIPVTSRHRAELRDSNEASYARDRSVSPPIHSTRYSRRQYSKPLSYEEEWGETFPSLTPDNLKKRAAEYEPSNSADGTDDAISNPGRTNPMSETGAVHDFRPSASPSSENSFSPIPSSDPVVNVTSAGRRVYFADERGYVDSVPERLANRHGNIPEAPAPPTPARKGNNKNAEVRSSRVIIPKMTMEDKDAKRVLKWQEDVALSLTDWAKSAKQLPNLMQRFERTTIAQPKMPSRDRGSSRRDTDLNGQPTFGEVKYARNYSADQVIYGSNHERWRGDSGSNREQGSYSKDPRLFSAERVPVVTYGPNPIKYREDTDLNNQQGSAALHVPDQVPWVSYGSNADKFPVAIYSPYPMKGPVVSYGRNPDRYREDTNLDDQQGPARGQVPEPITRAARPKKPSREGGSSPPW
jgi:hypothetical protein